MRLRKAVLLTVLVCVALVLTGAPGLAPTAGPLQPLGITVVRAAGCSSIYSVYNLSSQVATYLHDFSGSGQHYYFTDSLPASSANVYFLRDITAVPNDFSGSLTVSSDQNLATQLIGDECATATTGVVNPGGGYSSVGVSQQFTTYFMNGGGSQALDNVILLFASNGRTENGLVMYYRRSDNRMFLLSDDGSTWMGGSTPGTAVDIQNTQGGVHVGSSSANWSSNGRLLTLQWNIWFKVASAGKTFSMYTQAQYQPQPSGGLQDTGWNQKGTWTVTAASNPGLYQDGHWFLRNSNSGGVADATFWFGGAPGMEPAPGDWNGWHQDSRRVPRRPMVLEELELGRSGG